MTSRTLFFIGMLCVTSCVVAGEKEPEPVQLPAEQLFQQALADPAVQERLFELLGDRFAGGVIGGRVHSLLRAGQDVVNLINDGNLSDALGLVLEIDDPSVDGEQEPVLPPNPTLAQRAHYYAKKFGAHEIWYFSPLIELAEVLALDSKNMVGQVTGALAGQLSGVAATPVPGPDYFFNTYYRIPERVCRITRSQDIARVIRELPIEEQKRLRLVRNAQLISLALSGGLRVAQFLNKKTLNSNLLSAPLYIASMIIAWRRHKAIRREYNRLFKRAQLFLRQREQEEKERDRVLDMQLKEMRLKEMNIANHADKSGGNNEEEGAV